MHRVYVGDLTDQLVEGLTVELAGDEANHLLRVKRLQTGDCIELLDGRGGVGVGELLDPAFAFHAPHPSKRTRTVGVRVREVRHHARPSPRVEVWSAVPKGGRIDEMVDQLSQVGAAALVPMHCARSVVEPREHKLERVRRIALESAKQCGRAWLLEIETPRTLADALRPGGAIVLAHGDGSPCTSHVLDELRARGSDTGLIRLLIGPEGGFEEQERAAARAAGAFELAFGPNVMRIETAAVVAAARLVEMLGAGGADPRGMNIR